jgi:predicted nucleic-acid-binding Zn-ribbon protein
MTDEIIATGVGSRNVINQQANEFVEKALYDPNYTEFYREVY